MSDVTTQSAKEKAAKTAAFWGLMFYFPRALEQVAKVSMYGAGKHGVPLHNKGFLDAKYPITMYDDAEVRHIFGRAKEGEVNKADGDLLHRAQAAWNALAGLEKLLILYEQHKQAQSEPKEDTD